MKKEKQVRSYKRRTKSGKTVTVKAHTAKYEASDRAKEVSKKPGAGKELEERKKKPAQLEIPFDKEEEKKVLDEVSKEAKTPKKKSEGRVTKDPTFNDPNWESKMKKKYDKSKGDLTELKNAIAIGKGTEIRKALKNYKADAQRRSFYNPNRVHSDIANIYAHELLEKSGYNQYGYKSSKWKSTTHTLDTKTGKLSPPIKKKDTTTKTTTKPTISESAFTAAEFKEWYRGTGSSADKKVAKALRAQLGRSGYRKFEDEAIDNYSSRGHLSMFKRVSGAASEGKVSAKAKSKTSNPKSSGTSKETSAHKDSKKATTGGKKQGE